MRGSIDAGQIALVGAAFAEQTRAVRRAGRFACATALTRGRSLVGAAFTDQTRAVVESPCSGVLVGRGEGSVANSGSKLGFFFLLGVSAGRCESDG